MKFCSVLILLFLLATSAFSVEGWLTYSDPYPVRSAISYGGGVLMATDGGIRHRMLNSDRVYHSENGLETSSFYALASSERGVYAVSEFGLVAMLNKDGGSWKVLSRSYLSNNVRVRPDVAAATGAVLVIAFEDRLGFFDLESNTSILTIDRLGGYSMFTNPVEKLVISGDSLYVRMGGNYFVRKMDWTNLKGDMQLSNPASWSSVADPSKVKDLVPADSKSLVVDGDSLTFESLFDADKNRLVKWVVKAPEGYYLVSEQSIFFYSGAPDKSYGDMSIYEGYLLGETYELVALPRGGVIAASVDGYIDYGNGFQWNFPTAPLPGIGSLGSAYSNRVKVLATLPDGHVFFHVWGFGYFLYSDWGETLDYKFLASDGLCFDSFLDETPYSISATAVPAPDGSGFLTVTGRKSGYSIVYFTNDGEVHCAKQVGKMMMAGAMHSKLADDGSWIVYVGSRNCTIMSCDGNLDEFNFPAPRTNGGELSGGTLKTYRGLNNSLIDIAYDSVGKRLWVASMSTLAYLDEEQDSLIPPSSIKGLRGAEYTSLDVDVHGNLWLGTSNQGAYRLSLTGKSPDTLSAMSFSSRDGMLADDVADVAIDPVLGAAWFAHRKGVSCYFRKDLKYAGNNMTDSAKFDVVAYPIPFRPKIHARFTIDHIAEDAVVSIFNRGGALIRSFSGNDLLGGKVEWNGLGKDGRLVAPGVYYYVVRNSAKTKKGKFIIIH